MRHRRAGRAQRTRGVRGAVAGLVVVLLALLAAPVGPVAAVEEATGGTVSSETAATLTYRGFTATAAATRITGPKGQDGFWMLATTPHSSYNATNAMFAPAINVATTPTIGFYASAGMCGGTGITGLNWTGFCGGLGTVTIDFGHQVTNPIMDVSGLGGYLVCNDNSSANQCNPAWNVYGTSLPQNPDGKRTSLGFMSQAFTINTPGVSFAGLSAGQTNLSIDTANNRLEVADKRTWNLCDTPNQSVGNAPYSVGFGSTAGCGSVTLQGTFSSVTFSVGTWIERSASPNWATGYNYAEPDAYGNADLARVSFRLPEDQGDAPASYDVPGGVAAAHLSGPLKLGSGLTVDATAVRNPTTSANDGSGANLDTDDAVNGGVNAPSAAWGQAYSLPVPLSGTIQAGTLAGWIDFNGNGTFDAGERASTTYAAGATTATLSWTVPAGATALDTYLRLRTSFTASEVANATGVATSGEVEDYKIHIDVSAPSINVKKDAVSVTGPDASGSYVAAYTVTVKNSGTGAGTYGALTDTPGFSSNIVRTSATWTTSGSGVPAGPAAPVAGAPASYQLAPSGTSIAAGTTHTYNLAITFHYQDSAAPTACGATSGGLFNRVAVPGGQEADTTDNSACLVPPANVNVTKTAGSVSGPDAAGSYTATYTVKATNSGPSAGTYGALTDTPAFSGNLVRTSATWTTSGGAPAGPASAVTGSPASYQLAPSGTSIAAGATHVYNLSITFHFADRTAPSACNGTGTGLFNSVGVPAGQESDPTDDAACIAPPARYDVFLKKVGTDPGGATVAVDGSAWQLQTDGSGAPGTVVAGSVQPVSGKVGEFQLSSLTPGTYWLTETKAPSGYDLLAQPIRFTVSTTGVVTITGGGSSGISVQSTTSGPQLVVGDVAALKLPLTGGSGTNAFARVGAGLVLLAALVGLALALVSRWRRKAVDSRPGRRSSTG